MTTQKGTLEKTKADQSRTSQQLHAAHNDEEGCCEKR